MTCRAGTGSSSAVPKDAFAASSVVARAKASVCDVAEMCSGSSATVAPDAFKPSSFIVHPSTSSDNCDPTERCSGNSSVVPANVQQCTQVAIKVLGQSGKFTIYNNDTGTSDPNRVTVELDSLYELAANGAQIGKAGSSKHSINTFASQNFNIAKPVDAELNSKLNLVGPVSATKVSFSSTVGSVGIIEVDVLIMKNAGTIGSDKESWAVRANDVKFNIVLKDWKWCGGAATCKQGKAVEVGAFVDVAVKIKGKGTPTKSTKPGANKTVALGAGVALELSDRVSVDGKWAAMPAGYPKMSTVGGSVVVTFRFPKFSKIATYDPVVGMGCSAGANGQPCQNGGTAMGTSGNCKCSCASGVSGTNCEATKAPTRQPTKATTRQPTKAPTRLDIIGDNSANDIDGGEETSSDVIVGVLVLVLAGVVVVAVAVSVRKQAVCSSVYSHHIIMVAALASLAS